jgi:hypothetical protein
MNAASQSRFRPCTVGEASAADRADEPGDVTLIWASVRE